MNMLCGRRLEMCHGHSDGMKARGERMIRVIIDTAVAVKYVVLLYIKPIGKIYPTTPSLKQDTNTNALCFHHVRSGSHRYRDQIHGKAHFLLFYDRIIDAT